MIFEALFFSAVGLGGIAVLWPQLSVRRAKVVGSWAVQVNIAARSTMESRKPLYVLVARFSDAASTPSAELHVFPWHTDNVFSSSEEAEAALTNVGLTVGQLTEASIWRLAPWLLCLVPHHSRTAQRQIRVWLSGFCLIAVASVALLNL